MSSADAVYEELKDLANADQESFWVIYVNVKNKVIGKDIVALGGVDQVPIDMKVLFRRILLEQCNCLFYCPQSSERRHYAFMGRPGNNS